MFKSTLLLALSIMPSLTSIQQSAATDIPLPTIPDHIFNIVDFGAVSGGKKLNTGAIQKTIDTCSKAGGGTVLIPAGDFLTGPLTLANSLNLHLDEGATLRISNNPSDFKLTNRRYENCISVQDGHDIAITGKGTIDGQGEFWWKNFVAPKDAFADAPAMAHRPFMVTITRCQRVLVQDVLLTNSPMFHLVPQACQDVTIERVRFKAPAKAANTDALDPSGWNFLITGCVFDVGDDCIAVKATNKIDPDKPSCENFLITDCTFLHGHGLSVGGQSNGGLHHMVVRNCTFDSTDAGIRLKAGRGAGGLVEDLSYDNLTMKNVKVSIFITSFYPRIPTNPAEDPAKPVSERTPIWRNIRISNVKSEGGAVAGRILGLAEMPISDVVMSNVMIASDKGMEISNAQGIVFEHSQVSAKSGPPLNVQKSDVRGIDLATGRQVE